MYSDRGAGVSLFSRVSAISQFLCKKQFLTTISHYWKEPKYAARGESLENLIYSYDRKLSSY